MARYGGGQEDFTREARALDAIRREREREIAREVLYQKELTATTGLEDEAARRQATRRAAQREARTVTQRASEVVGREARATDIDTEAIERNTRARQRQAEAARRQAIDLSRALRGAQDPLFGQVGAAAASGQPMGVNDMRRQLGVGYGRARALQDALGAGFAPGNAGATGPQTRIGAAQLRVAAAELDFAEATRARAAALKRAGTTPEQLAGLTAARERADASRAAANLELSSARSEAEARAAASREAARSQRQVNQVREGSAAADANEAARRRNQNIVLHDPDAYARNMERDRAARAASTARRARIEERNAAQRAAVSRPGVIAEGGAVGGGRAFAAPLPGGAQAAAALTESTQAARLGADEIERRNKLYAEMEVYDRRAASAVRETTRATYDSAVSFGTASQQMTRHGALTSEFITAAARGETTMREMGNQALVTAGKFGGWTLAAGAVYGLADAAMRVGDGALSAQGGVQQLRRVIEGVDADEATEGFNRLSRQFNVPIEVAADAVYRMGQRFGNLPDAMRAAEASLYSFKTGEVDVATSTQNLLAVVNGFGLGADELVSVYDQINEAQNRFGIRIGETEAGLAKAAGTWRNSGGDLNYLLGLFVAISRATGRSGQEIGTGLSRAAVQLRQPGNVARLEAQGVEVDASNIQATIQSAMKAAQRPDADITAISTGLLGNQYFRLLEPVLREQDALNRALTETSPEASQGSAAQELAEVLGEAREQLAQIGNNLERLGSALARSGAFTALGIFVQGLNLTLDVVTRIVELFNMLPEDLRTGVMLLGQAYVLMRLMRRMGALDGLASTPFAPLAGREQRIQTHAVRGARDFVQLSFNEQERAAQRSFTTAHAAERARNAAEAARTDMATRVSSGQLVPDSDKYVAALEHRRELELRAQAMMQRSVDAADELNDAKAIAVRSEGELAKLQALHRDEVRAYLRANDTPIPRNLDAPSTAGIMRGGDLDPQANTQRTGTARDVLRHIDAQERKLADADARVAATNERITRAGDRMGITGRLLGRAGVNANDALSDGAARMAAGADRLDTLPNRVRNVGRDIVDSIGPLDALIGGLTVAYMILEPKLRELQQRNEDAEALLSRSESRFAPTRAAQRREGIGLAEQMSREPTGLENVAGAVNTGWRYFDSAIGFNPSEILFGEREGPQETIDRNRERAQRQLQLQEMIARQQAAQRARNPEGPVANRFASEVSHDIENTTDEVMRGQISFDEAMDEIRRSRVEAVASVRIGPRRQDRLKRQEQEALRQIRERFHPENFADRFETLNADQLREQIGSTTARIGRSAQPVSNFDLRELGASYRYLTIQQRGANTPAELQQVMADREAFFSAFETLADREREEGLLFATSESGRRNVFRRSRQTLRRMVSSARAAARNSRQEVVAIRERIAEARDALNGLSDIPENLPGGARIFRTGQNDSAHGELEQATDDLRAEMRQLNRDEKAIREAMSRRRLALARVRQEAFADRQEGRQVSLALAQSRTDSPVRDAQLAVAAAERDAQDARGFGESSRQFRTALTALNEARTAQADAIKQAQEEAEQQAEERRQNELEVQRLLGEIAVARAGDDPVDAARAAMRVAQQARASATNRRERLQALLDFIQANNDLEEALRDREDARFDLLASRTQDPVKDARIEVRRARNNLEGTTGAERTRAQAQLNEAKQNLRTTQASETQETINFQLEMGRITRDQAIRQLEALKQGADLTRDMRRDIARQIKQLKDAGDQEASGFDLDVGNLKLPTIYDVRRAYAPLRRAIRDQREAARAGRLGADIRTNVANMHDQRSQVNAQVNVYVNDKNAAGEVYTALDRVLRTDTRSAMRSAGVG